MTARRAGGLGATTPPVGLYTGVKIGLGLILLLVAGGVATTVGPEGAPPRAAFVVVALGFLVWGLSAALMSRQANLQRFTWFQLVFDAALVSGLIALTGGLDSPLTVLYFLNIIATPFLLPPWALAVVVALDVAGFATVLALGAVGALPWLGGTDSPPDVQGLVLHVFGMALVGTLSMQLTRSMKGLLERQVERGRALLAEQARVLDELNVGSVELDAAGTVVELSEVARRLLGEREIAGLGELWSDGADAWERTVEVEGKARQILLSRHRREGGDGLILVQDLTRLREMEAAVEREERLAAVGRLAAAMAHEIRNPLASLSGAIQVMQADRGDELHEIALREVNRLDALVEEFLDAARPPRLDRVRFDLGLLVAEVVRTFRADPRYRDLVELELDASEGGLEVEMDPARTRQVLWNLLLNAAQHMPEGGTIHITLRRHAGRIDLRIRDEGVGIAPENISRIFDPFFSTRSGGTGLGLANVERIVRAHGGALSVYSKQGQGTSFMISLSRGSSEGENGEAPGRQDRQAPEVLEVDD